MDIFILILATWRISSLLAREEGPLDILVRFRALAGVKYDERSEPVGSNNFAKGLICMWCNSVWIGIAFAVMYAIAGQVSPWMAVPLAFALSAGALIVEGVVKYGAR